MHVSLSSLSFSVGAVCTGLMNGWLSLVWSRHDQTVPLGLGTMTKVLHHLAVSSTPYGASIYCS